MCQFHTTAPRAAFPIASQAMLGPMTLLDVHCGKYVAGRLNWTDSLCADLPAGSCSMLASVWLRGQYLVHDIDVTPLTFLGILSSCNMCSTMLGTCQ